MGLLIQGSEDKLPFGQARMRYDEVTLHIIETFETSFPKRSCVDSVPVERQDIQI